jgi:hypothetical protein
LGIHNANGLGKSALKIRPAVRSDWPAPEIICLFFDRVHEKYGAIELRKLKMFIF